MRRLVGFGTLMTSLSLGAGAADGQTTRLASTATTPVTALLDRNRRACEEVAAELRAEGGRALPIEGTPRKAISWATVPYTVTAQAMPPSTSCRLLTPGGSSCSPA